jgi:endonuclease/exonuclease/phosphatase family metal-dependent hydrolase
MVTANLHEHQADPRIVNDFLIQTRPDVVTLQVFNPKTDLPYLHQPGWQMEVSDGIMIASRWPITLIDKSAMGEAPETADEIKGGVAIDGSAGRYLVHAPFGDFQVVSLHLTSPHHALSMMKRQGNLAAHLLSANSVRRANSSAALAAQVRLTPGPVLLGGDFNTTDDSPIFRNSWSAYNDAFSVAGFGFGTSYAQHHTWLRIDHILYDPSWQCHTAFTSGDIGSGHRAVFAELSR